MFFLWLHSRRSNNEFFQSSTFYFEKVCFDESEKFYFGTFEASTNLADSQRKLRIENLHQQAEDYCISARMSACSVRFVFGAAADILRKFRDRTAFVCCVLCLFSQRCKR